MRTKNVLYTLAKQRSHIAAIAQNTVLLTSAIFTVLHGKEHAFAVGNGFCNHRHDVRQSLRINCDGRLIPEIFLQASLLFCPAISVFVTLCIAMIKKCAACVAPLFVASRATLIFLLRLLQRAHSLHIDVAPSVRI